ncbi:MAG: hypothetical protein AAGI17_09130, partial [Planctomycetota bacterium]
MNTKNVCAIALVGCAGSASAQLDIFDDRSAWSASLTGPVAVEGFEGRDAVGPLGSPSIFDSGLMVSIFSGNVDTAVESGDPLGAQLQNTTVGGSQYLRIGNAGEQEDYTVTFELTNVTDAFGVDLSDWEPGQIQLSQMGLGVELYREGQLVIGFFQPSDLAVDGGLSFFGLTTTLFEFDEIRLTFDQIGEFFPNTDIVGFDEVAWVVPTPGSAAVVALGGLVASRRRR